MNRPAQQLPPHRRTGFTLLELVLVMLMLTTVLAMVIPSLRGFWRRSRSRDAATQLVTMTRWAEARAAADGRVYRLNVSAAAGAYWMTVQGFGDFAPVGSDFGRVFTLPEGTFVEVVQSEPATGSLLPASAGADAGSIDFYPDGRRDVAVIRMVDSRGAVTVIACRSPAEPYRVLTPAQLEGL